MIIHSARSNGVSIISGGAEHWYSGGWKVGGLSVFGMDMHVSCIYCWSTLRLMTC